MAIYSFTNGLASTYGADFVTQDTIYNTVTKTITTKLRRTKSHPLLGFTQRHRHKDVDRFHRRRPKPLLVTGMLITVTGL